MERSLAPFACQFS